MWVVKCMQMVSHYVYQLEQHTGPSTQDGSKWKNAFTIPNFPHSSLSLFHHLFPSPCSPHKCFFSHVSSLYSSCYMFIPLMLYDPLVLLPPCYSSLYHIHILLPPAPSSQFPQPFSLYYNLLSALAPCYFSPGYFPTSFLPLHVIFPAPYSNSILSYFSP